MLVFEDFGHPEKRFIGLQHSLFERLVEVVDIVSGARCISLLNCPPHLTTFEAKRSPTNGKKEVDDNWPVFDQFDHVDNRFVIWSELHIMVTFPAETVLFVARTPREPRSLKLLQRVLSDRNYMKLADYVPLRR
jgi:hypothetical protein